MERNVGRNDRILRLVLGVALLVLGVLSFAGVVAAGGGTAALVLRTIVVLLGAAFAVTGLAQVCPVNRALGIDTLQG